MISNEFEAIVDAHYQPLYRFAYSLAKDSHGASDLTQQAFYIFAQKGHQLRDRSKVKSWLFTTLHREFLKLRRRSQRMVSVEDPEPLMEAPLHDSGDANARKLDGTSVVEALDQIDEIYRAPLSLFYLQQISYKEIAAILDVPIGTVMSRLSRGKDQLRKIVAAAETGDGKIIRFPTTPATSHSSTTQASSSSSSSSL